MSVIVNVPVTPVVFYGLATLLVLIAVLYGKISRQTAAARFTIPTPIHNGRQTVDRWMKETEHKFEAIFRRSHMRRYVYVFLVLSSVSFIATYQVFNNMGAAVVVALTLFMLPQYVVGMLDDRRIKQIEEQLPIALRFFKTTYAQTKKVERGLSAVAHKLPNPIGAIFSEAHFDHLAGYPAEYIYKKMTLSLKSHYGFMFVQILQQLNKNANAVDLLEELAMKVEDHLEITREHYSKISIERLSFLILVLAPFPVYLSCQWMVPEIQRYLTQYFFGKIVIAITFVSLFLWVLVDARMRNVE